MFLVGCSASQILEDERSLMGYQSILTKMMAKNISIIAVIDDDSPNPEIVGTQILSVASKNDPELPEVRKYLIIGRFNMGLGDGFLK